MLKYANHDIVFQEFPDEVTLAVNLSCCPNGCPGCHSAWLQGDVGEVLTEERLWALAESYRGEVTCVALMGGDNDPETVMHLLRSLRRRSGDALRTGWYSGRAALPACFDP
ncbi:MAG: anaerobic ribonucleoside-triphosphate reductase activating protein, partial [Alloprevotella sp.]|nr:anaerobic ribonucleoside-triphosphate reductase activating protein [Alloprevotella sp.]